MTAIHTLSGRTVDLLDPKPSGLAKQCRYRGLESFSDGANPRFFKGGWGDYLSPASPLVRGTLLLVHARSGTQLRLIVLCFCFTLLRQYVQGSTSRVVRPSTLGTVPELSERQFYRYKRS